MGYFSQITSSIAKGSDIPSPFDNLVLISKITKNSYHSLFVILYGDDYVSLVVFPIVALETI
jgi:hypothetical protein